MADTKLVRYRPSPMERVRGAIRGYQLGNMLSSDPGIAGWLGASSVTSTGLHVTDSNVLTYSAVWSAVTLIASQIGNLPLMFYRKLPNGGKDKWETNNLYRLVHDRPNPITSAFIFRETLQAHVLLWGNAYAEIQRNGAGRPTALWPLTPDRVTPFIDRGTLRYRVIEDGQADSYVESADMLHIPGHGWNGICGYSLVQKMRESVGVGLAAEKFGATFFGNGATFGGVIASPNPRPTDERVIKNDREALNARHQGVDRAHKLLLLYGGAKYEAMGIAPNEAQFLETRQFQVDEVARWFNVPPHKLKQLARATYDTVEHQNIEYYVDCLAPWLERWEQELCEKLISPLERSQQTIEFSADGLLRGDIASRGDAYAKRFNTGSITPNDIRLKENENPIDGGDEAYVPLNTIPLSLAKPYYQAQIEALTAKAEADRRPPPESAPTPDPAQAREIERLMGELAEARKLSQEREDAKDRIAAETSQERTILAADLSVAKTLIASQETRIADLTLHVSKWAEERDYEFARAEEAIQARDAAKDLTAKTAGELTQVTIERDAVTAERDQERAEHAQTKEALSLDVIEAQRHQAEAEAREVETRAELVKMTAQATSLGTDLIAAQRDLQASTDAIAVIEADFQRAREDKQALAVRAEAGDAVVIELRAQVQTLTTDGAALMVALTNAKEQLGRLEETQAEAKRKADVLDQQLRAHAAALLTLEQRHAQTPIAVRGVLIDAVQRGMVNREIDRARKQMTPDKLAKWIESFYPMHEDVCRTIMRPAVKAWLISAGHDIAVDLVLDRVIPAYIGESTRTLRGLLAEHDMESLPPALERVLRRWESERAEALADRILKEAA